MPKPSPRRQKRRAPARPTRPANPFKAAVDATGILCHKDGLHAITNEEGGGRIVTSDGRMLLGSVALDTDCKKSCPRDPRWDYAIGARKGNKPHVYWVEVHPADASGVKELVKKHAWLQTFLDEQRCSKLRDIECSYHWVASGKNHIIPSTANQYRLMQKTPFGKPVKHLSIP